MAASPGSVGPGSSQGVPGRGAGGLSSAKAPGARSQVRTAPGPFPVDWEPPWADVYWTLLPSHPALRKTLFRKNKLRPEQGEGFEACICFLQPACPAQRCLSQGDRSCPQREAVFQGGGSGGVRCEGLPRARPGLAVGQAAPASTRGLQAQRGRRTCRL